MISAALQSQDFSQNFLPTPCPGLRRGSVPVYWMFSRLRQDSIGLKDIKAITLETGPLSEFFTYIRAHKDADRLKTLFDVNPNVTVTVCGFDDLSEEQKKKNLAWFFPKLPNNWLSLERSRLVFWNAEHECTSFQSRNVIRLEKGASCIWYINHLESPYSQMLRKDTWLTQAIDHLFPFASQPTPERGSFMPEGPVLHPLANHEAEQVEMWVKEGRPTEVPRRLLAFLNW